MGATTKTALELAMEHARQDMNRASTEPDAALHAYLARVYADLVLMHANRLRAEVDNASN